MNKDTCQNRSRDVRHEWRSAIDFWTSIVYLPVLSAVGLSDLRYMKIPNKMSFWGLGIFLLAVPVIGTDTALMRLAIASIAFAICFGLFSIGWLGGGDAKILPVTLLFVPAQIMPIYPIYLVSFSICMLAGMIFVWCVRQQYLHAHSSWVFLRPGTLFPMGISIATSLPLALALASTS